jgi:DNA-directed RNA polymerase subunit E'/Rpb7
VDDGELLTDEELPDSLSSYVPKGTSLNGSGEKSESLEERSVTSEECDMDLEEETPDTTIKKSSGKKQKKGITVRAEINSVAAQMVQEEEPNVEVRKRKPGLGTVTATEPET